MQMKTFPKGPSWEAVSRSPRKMFLVHEIEPEIAWSEDTTELSLLAQLKPAWYALKAMGLLPIFSDRQAKAIGGRRTALLLLQAAYAGGFYCLFTALAYEKLLYLKSNMSGKATAATTRLTFGLIALSFLVPHVLIAPLHWIKMSNFLMYIKNWDTFQARFLMVTHHQLRLNMKRRAAILITLVVAGSVSFCYVLLTSMTKSSKWVYIYSMTQINVLLAMWVLLCQANAKAAGQLARRLKEEFHKTGVVGEHVVHGYHRVWLRLSKLTRDIGTMFSAAFTVIVMFWLVLMLLSAFLSATLLANKCPGGMLFGVILLALLGYGSVQIFCHAASLATEAVRDQFLDSLVGIEVDTIEIQKQLQDLEMVVCVHDVVINLGGFFNVNRALVVSIMSAFATFLVVLFQSTSASDSGGCSFKPTSTSGTQ